MLALARRVLDQKQHQSGPKVYSLHAPEVECIGKGKAHRPYEFGVKVSVATTLSRAKGGQFVTHAKSLPGNPYDGHTLKTVIPEMEALIGNIIERLLGDKGYRGHNAPPEYKFRVFTSGQKRRVTPQIKRELRRRTGDRPPQVRSSNGPKLSLAPPRRRHQCRPRRCWLQLPASHPLAAALVAPNPRSAQPPTSVRPKLKSGFFTDDYLWTIAFSNLSMVDSIPLQLHGGYGYMQESPIALMWADSRVQRIYGGANAVLKEVVGSSLRIPVKATMDSDAWRPLDPVDDDQGGA